MPSVAIEKVTQDTAKSTSVLEELNALAERTRQRAFELFQMRGGGDGNAMNDWLDAERDLFWAPNSELIERDHEFEVQVAAPGFEPDDIHVTALPEAIIVQGRSTHKHKSRDGNIRFCEFDSRELLRRLDLPKPINVNKVTASLDKGVLRLIAVKGESLGRQTEGGGKSLV